MKIDLSVKVDRQTLAEMLDAYGQTAKLDLEKQGHVGTHFDVMDKEFPIEKVVTRGKVFDISHFAIGGEVKAADIDLSNVEEDDFVLFYSAILKQRRYGTKEYFAASIELTDGLIDQLLAKKISFIGIDMSGAQKPAHHQHIDQYCADHGVFIIENLNNLDVLLKETEHKPFRVYTFPVNMSGFSGLPSRVIAEI